MASLAEKMIARRKKLNQLASEYPYGSMPIDKKSAEEMAKKKAALVKKEAMKSKEIVERLHKQMKSEQKKSLSKWKGLSFKKKQKQ